MNCISIKNEKLKNKEAQEVRSWGRYVDGEGYKIFSSDAINKIHGWMEKCFRLEQQNTALQERIKELEEKNKIGFQALNCGQCQGGGCPVCGGSGFVFGKILEATYIEPKQNQ